VRSKLFGTRRRKVATIAAVAALVIVSAAVAAWVTYNITGFGGGQFGQTSSGTLTFAENNGTAAGACLPGGDCDLSFTYRDDGNPSLTIQSLSIGAATADNAPAGCTIPAGGITLNPGAGVGTVVPPTSGGNNIITIQGALHASDSLPVCLAGSKFNVPVTGTAG
jgi:hypothetical protein